jgi:quinoprotein glucose dehydrogenase
MKRVLSVLIVLVGVSLTLAAQRSDNRQVEWLYYGGDPGGMKYSTLTDVNPGNIQRLQKVWEWKHWETPMEEYGTIPGFFEATPLMIDGVLYVTTPYNSVAALDAETGKELWRFDGEAYKLGQVLSGSGYKLRGTAFWRDRGTLRIFLNSRERLFMLDAKTGKPVPSFGDSGQVHLNQGMARIAESKHVTQSSPPVIYKDLVIMGSQIPDRVQIADPVGQVQAINARTGKREWVYSVIPQSSTDAGADTWEGESWRTHGHGNVWAPMVIDEPRGLIYLPTTTPSSDFYGGNRPGANLFAESLVCLDANTGKMKWYFQAIHHGLWDWDFPAPPNLITITVDGKRIDAVAQVSKQGFTYVFDRVTGRPVWPIVERPVPTDTDVPGEKPYPTQPFPTKPPPFIGQGVTLEDANNLTPEINRLAREQMQKFRIGPIYTPPSLIGTLMRPGAGGGASWGGAAFDPESAYLFVRASHSIGVNRVAKNNGSDALVKVDYSNMFARGGGGGGPNLPGGLPILSPPYNVLTAYDMNKGEIAWQIPVGEGSQTLRNHPLLKGVQLPDRLGGPTSRGGAMVTRSGLVFIGGGDKYFYAFDKRSGKELWRAPVPYEETAVPMTYRTRSGRQFVVMATGESTDNALVAFALDGSSPTP